MGNGASILTVQELDDLCNQTGGEGLHVQRLHKRFTLTDAR
jgi:hypothetical protein